MTEPDREPRPWHALSTEAALAALGSTAEGLAEAEAAARLQRWGPNRLRPPKRRSAWRRFLTQFHNVLIYVLLAAAAVTVALGHWVDAAVIAGVVVLNALIGFVQEGKAEEALDAIRHLLAPQASVRRGGRRRTVPADGLVPGDLVSLQSGDRVPADLRLLWVKNLKIDEAALTGESVPVDKATAPTAEAAPLGDRSGMAYSGTLVATGQGTGLVVATGEATELGRISGLLARVQPLATPLLRKMGEFGRLLALAILAVAAAVSTFGMLVHGYGPGEMFLAAVGLAVAAIPEGLPAVVTITLAIGVQRMAGRNAIVRRLPAVETLGSVTVICTDKTGTLTRNEMMVQTVVTAGALLEVTGSGYDTHGEIRAGEQTAPYLPDCAELARAGLLCNDGTLEHRLDGRVQAFGDPMEVALIALAHKAGLDPALERREYPRIDLIPFESEHRFMATLHHDHAGHAFVCVKGAPERVLEMCSHQRHAGRDEPLDAAYWRTLVEVVAGRGQRLLAIAFGGAGAGRSELRFEELEGGLTLLGIAGIIDPPREEAVTAVGACRSAGIRVKMITGDHALTARAIGWRLGIGDGRSAVTGRELDAMPAGDLAEQARGVDVFARVSPEHKLRLVQALQAGGEVVAMTGDGVNDAPALKRADVGVAMGMKGTEAAKEAAEMVLADDNFATIARAVEEGRTVYDNIKKSILFILPTNGGEALTIMAAVMMGMMLPITPVQVLWVNMITAVTLGLALAFEAPEAEIMRRPPRPPAEPLMTGLLIWRTVFVALIIVAGTFGLFLWARTAGAPIEDARTVAVNTLVMFEVFYLLNTRYLSASVLSRAGLLGNRYVLMAIALVLAFQALFTYLPPLQALFGTAPLGADAWLRIVATASTLFVAVEMEKGARAWLQRRRARDDAPAA